MRKVLFILGFLADEDIDWITTVGSRVDLNAGDELISGQSTIDQVFMLLDGELSVRAGNASGAEIARRYPGEILGELSLLHGGQTTESVVAFTSVSVVAIPRIVLDARLESNVPFAARFYKSIGVMLASRFRQSMGHVTDDGSADEIDPDLLEQTAIAGIRFNRIVEYFRDL